MNSKTTLPASSILINEEVYNLRRQGVEPTVLSLGEAFFDIPNIPFDDDDFKRGMHYSEGFGIRGLRENVLGEYAESSLDATIDNVIITSGSKFAIYALLSSIINGSNDEVILLEPAWLSYKQQIQLAGGKAKLIKSNVEVNELAHHISTNTRAIIINNPNNPSGKNYSKEEVEIIAKISVENDLWLIVDEAYSDFVKHSDEIFNSSCEHFNKTGKVVLVNSFSKNLGISGWRLGYIICPDALLLRIRGLIQHIITCPPSLLQLHLNRNYDAYKDVVRNQLKNLYYKRKRITEYIVSKGLKMLSGSTTFYIMLCIDGSRFTDIELAFWLLRNNNISVVPGSSYGGSLVNYIRLSIGTETEDRIFKAIDTIDEYINNADQSYYKMKEYLEETNDEFYSNLNQSLEEL